MKKLKSGLALFLLAAFSLAILPKEFLHAFHDHEDTHHDHITAGFSLEEEHTHCEILNIESPVFVAADQVFDFAVHTIRFQYLISSPAEVYYTDFNLPALRGPPAC